MSVRGHDQFNCQNCELMIMRELSANGTSQKNKQGELKCLRHVTRHTKTNLMSSGKDRTEKTVMTIRVLSFQFRKRSQA